MTTLNGKEWIPRTRTCCKCRATFLATNPRTLFCDSCKEVKKDKRPIQEVLRLHVKSCQSMADTYERMGDKEQRKFQEGMVAGLERAIEVADYRDSEKNKKK